MSSRAKIQQLHGAVWMPPGAPGSMKAIEIEDAGPQGSSLQVVLKRLCGSSHKLGESPQECTMPSAINDGMSSLAFVSVSLVDIQHGEGPWTQTPGQKRLSLSGNSDAAVRVSLCCVMEVPARALERVCGDGKIEFGSGTLGWEEPTNINAMPPWSKVYCGCSQQDIKAHLQISKLLGSAGSGLFQVERVQQFMASMPPASKSYFA